MTIVKYIFFSFFLFMIGVFAEVIIRAADQPLELKAINAEPEVIHSGAMMMFKFVFNTPMDTSITPIMHLDMEGEHNVSFPAVWYDINTCGYSYFMPTIRENGTAEIILTGAVTRDGKDVKEIHTTVKTMPGPEPDSLMR